MSAHLALSNLAAATVRSDGRKIRAGVLGATGMVGQRLVHLLADHPWFELTEVAASERSSGKTYGEAVHWHLETLVPGAARDLVVKGLDPSLDCDFFFSALDSSVAGPAEEDFARAGYPVVSNSRNHRMDPDVPLLIPEVNAAHLDAIPLQQKNRGYDTGFIVTNPNCSTAGLVLVLKPLADAFGLEKIFVVTLQAISGAGYPGSLYGHPRQRRTLHQRCRGNEAEAEAPRQGTTRARGCRPWPQRPSNRVPVVGHLECVSIGLKIACSEVREPRTLK
jgi:aspartate-semialdehyde dehydrogenase